jgi:hypothetical protein
MPKSERPQISHHPDGPCNEESQAEFGPVQMGFRVSDQARNANQHTKECQHESHQANRQPCLAIDENGNRRECKCDRADRSGPFSRKPVSRPQSNLVDTPVGRRRAPHAGNSAMAQIAAALYESTSRSCELLRIADGPLGFSKTLWPGIYRHCATTRELRSTYRHVASFVPDRARSR